MNSALLWVNGGFFAVALGAALGALLRGERFYAWVFALHLPVFAFLFAYVATQ